MRIKILGFILLSSISALAQFEITHYVGLGGGTAAFTEGTAATSQGIGDAVYEPGYSMEFVYGAKFSDGVRLPFRLELAAGYQACEIKELDTGAGTVPVGETATMLSIFGNAYLDIPTGSAVTPFLLVGLGGGMMDYGAYDATAILFQLGVGVGVELSEHWMLDLKLKLNGFGALDQKDYDVAGVKMQVGARYMF